MTFDRNTTFALTLVLISFGATLLGYDLFPEQVPTHWNIHGVADGFAAKPYGLLTMPVVLLLVWGLFVAIPHISPRGFEVTPSRGFGMMQVATIAFLFVVWLVTSLAALGTAVSVDRVITVALGVLFVVLGNFMGTLKKNFFVGIRTPWTLANDEVWERTHRLGGKLFVIGGFLMTVTAFALPEYFAFAAVAAGVLGGVIPSVHSFLLSRRLSATTPTSPTADDIDAQ